MNGNLLERKLFVGVRSAHPFDHKSYRRSFIVNVCQLGMKHALFKIEVFDDVVVKIFTYCQSD